MGAVAHQDRRRPAPASAADGRSSAVVLFLASGRRDARAEHPRRVARAVRPRLRGARTAPTSSSTTRGSTTTAQLAATRAPPAVSPRAPGRGRSPTRPSGIARAAADRRPARVRAARAGRRRSTASRSRGRWWQAPGEVVLDQDTAASSARRSATPCHPPDADDRARRPGRRVPVPKGAGGRPARPTPDRGRHRRLGQHAGRRRAG